MPSPEPRAYELELAQPAARPDSLSDALGVPRFTIEDQADAPNEPRTRIVKDVLHTGQWRVGNDPTGKPRFWEVKDGTLGEICRQYKLARSRGVSSNLYWGAPTSDNQHNVSSRDAIAPIDDLVVVGGRLYATQYVTPQQAAELSNPAHKVSVRVQPEWTDGAGHTYPLMLEHVAIVDQPVVSGQGSFFELANEQGGKPMGDLKRVINEMLKVMDLSEIPEGTSDDDLVKVLETKLQTLKDLTEDKAAELPVETPENNDLSNETVEDLKAQVLELSNTLNSIRAAETEAKKDAWSSKLDSLFDKNCIDAAVKGTYLGKGEALGYDLSLLEPLGSLSLQAHPESASAGAGGSEAPSTGGASKVRSNEEVEADLKARGVKSRVVAQAR